MGRMVKKFGRVGPPDEWRIIGVLYEDETNPLYREWKIMACQEQYGIVNQHWLRDGAFIYSDSEDEVERSAILKAIKRWEESERNELIGNA